MPGGHPKRRWQSSNAAACKAVALAASVVQTHPGVLVCQLTMLPAAELPLSLRRMAALVRLQAEALRSRISPVWEAVSKTAVAGATPERDSRRLVV